MSNSTDDKLTRRQALATGLAGAASLATLGSPVRASAAREDGPHASASAKMPVVYLPHGGGPWPFVELGFGDRAELDALAAYLREIAAVPRSPIKALLVVSAHWEMPAPTVMTHPKPPMLYDYYGFPPESYQITWPAPGSPALAARVRELLRGAGIDSAEDPERGFDHGTFVPLKLAFPEAAVPTVQLSLVRGLDPAAHLALGRALAPLRDEGVFIVGSGMSFHNLRAFGDPRARAPAGEFDAWLREAVTAAPTDRDAKLTQWAAAPGARICHPREEHLLPLMVIAGAAGPARGTVEFGGTLTGLPLSGFQFG